MPWSALGVLAALARDNASEQQDSVDVVRRSPEWQWEGLRHLGLFMPEPIRWAIENPNSSRPALTEWWPNIQAQSVSDTSQARRLAGLDQLRSHERILRLGWLWLAGIPETGPLKGQTICLPLLSRVVSIDSSVLGSCALEVEGDVFANRLIQNEKLANQMVANPEFGGGTLSEVINTELLQRLTKLRAWGTAAAAEIGISIHEWLPPSIDPRSRRRGAGVGAIPGVGIFVDPAASRFNRRDSLHRWIRQDGLEETAFSAMYMDGDDPVQPPLHRVHAPLRLTRSLDEEQRQIVLAARTEPVLGVTGPPGSGKTHTLCEVALDAIARGETVLIGANSEQAVSVLARQLSEVRGPVPVLFGGSRTGRELSIQLSDLLAAASGEQQLGAERAARESMSAHGAQVARLEILLDIEVLAARLQRDPVFRLECEERFALMELHRQQCEAALTRSGISGSLKRRRAARLLGMGSAELRQQLHEATRYFQARSSVSHGGDSLGGSFDELLRLENSMFAANASWLEQITLERLGQSRSGRRIVNEVSVALRASRARRRDMLTELDGDALADSAPLWLGTVSDIDDVLPIRPAMFDLVILDEASQMDQVSSAGALLRASRAVVGGDARQLRHVSFVSDEAIAMANQSRREQHKHHIDTRRTSTLDQAVAAGKGRSLRTHYRSSPHLISFSANRFYGGVLDVATTTPANEQTDLIDVYTVAGSRDSNKVNHVEIEAVLDHLLLSTGRVEGRRPTSIGLVTPFRPQADALIEALLERHDAGYLERRGIEVGTVHSFQGAEFDVVIASWCLSDIDGPRSWAFLNDPGLFNVMITRARHKLIVITSMPQPPGLAGDFVRHGESGPEPLGLVDADGWTGRVAATLTDAGLHVSTGYPVGSFIVDLVLRDVRVPTAVICEPHPIGVVAHLQRDQMLRRMGWTVIDAMQGRWDGDLAQFAIELQQQVDG